MREVRGFSPLPVFLGLVAGLAGGLVSACYRMMLSEAESFSMHALTGRGALSSLALLPLWIAGAVVIGLLMERAPMARRGGVPRVKDEFAGGPAMNWWRVLAAKFAAGGLGIALGLSLGRGGPSVQMGAAAGKGVGGLLGAGDEERRLLLAGGAAAGLSATFNAPLAGAVFVMEAVAPRSVPAALSALSASWVAGRLAGGIFASGPLFSFGGIPAPSAGLLPHYLVLGILCGAAGVLFRRMSAVADSSFERVPPAWRVIPPALAALVLARLLPQVLTGGHGMIESIASGGYGLKVLLFLFVVKLAFTVMCTCSGAAGGLFYPTLAVGAALGALYAAVASRAGLAQLSQVGFLMAGMAGLISSVMRTPATAVILVAEMAGTGSHLLPAATTSIAALLVSCGGKW
ncbi:MAG: hypothetical protein GX181_09850 [Synergistaceae bacterium]|nr:chloride channel protein [Synergistota bacterium]NLM72242.1 hypothetical protein [Synergistaceae bacterium]